MLIHHSIEFFCRVALGLLVLWVIQALLVCRECQEKEGSLAHLVQKETEWVLMQLDLQYVHRYWKSLCVCVCVFLNEPLPTHLGCYWRERIRGNSRKWRCKGNYHGIIPFLKHLKLFSTDGLQVILVKMKWN